MKSVLNKVFWASRLKAYHFKRTTSLLRPLRIEQTVDAWSALPDLVRRVQEIEPAASEVRFDLSPADQAFLTISKYFRDGRYDRASAFVCEVPEGLLHVGTGLVCTRDFRAIDESQMAYRIPMCEPFHGFKPWRPRRISLPCATIQNVFWPYWWHWIVDCLPRLVLLEEGYPDLPIALLVPEELGSSFLDSLRSVLPGHLSIQALPGNTWVRADCLILPSYLSGRSNGHLPARYYEAIRRRVFARLGFSSAGPANERLYVSRAGASRRRVLNEEALLKLLVRFGFRSVAPETMSFRDQVKLFRDAEVIVAAHGSNWGNLIFSQAIKFLVLYPDSVPNTHIFTLAKALGQQHFFVAGTEDWEDADFIVDLEATEEALTQGMGLRPRP